MECNRSFVDRIKVHHLICGMTLLVAPVLAPLFPVNANSAEDRPNVVMIISDDQTYTDFGFMGNHRVHTPHLDQLASRSSLFTNGYVPASVCRPSLVTLLTGRYPHQHGVHFNHPPPGFAKLTKTPTIGRAQYNAYREAGAALIRDVSTLPRLLADHGYRCFQSGKFWEGHYRNAGFTDGMTTSEPSGGKYGDKELAGGDIVAHGNGDHGLVIGRETMKPIEDFLDRARHEPFFIWYAPFLPHTPHDAPRRYFDLVRARPDVAEHEIPYFASIAQFDDSVAKLFGTIRRRGLADNTLFVFVVDNGWQPDSRRYIANRGEWDHTKRSKRAPFEAGLRTPIFFHWKNRIAHQTVTRPISSVQIMPTILQACRIDASSLSLPADGLLPELIGETRGDPMSPVYGAIYPGDATVLGHPGRDVAYRWIRQGRFKLIVPVTEDGKSAWNQYVDRPALYDVVSDPNETIDLIDADEQSSVAAKLHRLLDQWWTPKH